jgi:hypothetical protein
VREFDEKLTFGHVCFTGPGVGAGTAPGAGGVSGASAAAAAAAGAGGSSGIGGAVPGVSPGEGPGGPGTGVTAPSAPAPPAPPTVVALTERGFQTQEGKTVTAMAVNPVTGIPTVTGTEGGGGGGGMRETLAAFRKAGLSTDAAIASIRAGNEAAAQGANPQGVASAAAVAAAKAMGQSDAAAYEAGQKAAYAAIRGYSPSIAAAIGFMGGATVQRTDLATMLDIFAKSNIPQSAVVAGIKAGNEAAAQGANPQGVASAAAVAIANTMGQSESVAYTAGQEAAAAVTRGANPSVAAAQGYSSAIGASGGYQLAKTSETILAKYNLPSRLSDAETVPYADRAILAAVFQKYGNVTNESIQKAMDSGYQVKMSDTGYVLADKGTPNVTLGNGQVVPALVASAMAMQGINGTLLADAQREAFETGKSPSQILSEKGYSSAAQTVSNTNAIKQLTSEVIPAVKPESLESYLSTLDLARANDKEYINNLEAASKAYNDAVAQNRNGIKAIQDAIVASTNNATGFAIDNKYGFQGQVTRSAIGDFANIIAPGISMIINKADGNALVFRNPSDPLGGLLVWSSKDGHTQTESWGQFNDRYPDLKLGTKATVTLVPDMNVFKVILQDKSVVDVTKEGLKALVDSGTVTKEWASFILASQKAQASGTSYIFRNDELSLVQLPDGKKYKPAEIMDMYPNAVLPSSPLDMLQKGFGLEVGKPVVLPKGDYSKLDFNTVAGNIPFARADQYHDQTLAIFKNIWDTAKTQGQDPVATINALTKNDDIVNRATGQAQEGNIYGLKGQVFQYAVDENTNLVAPKTLEEAVKAMPAPVVSVPPPHSAIQLSRSGNQVFINNELVTKENAEQIFRRAQEVLKSDRHDLNAQMIVEIGNQYFGSTGEFNPSGFVSGLNRDITRFPNKYVLGQVAPIVVAPSAPIIEPTAEGAPIIMGGELKSSVGITEKPIQQYKYTMLELPTNVRLGLQYMGIENDRIYTDTLEQGFTKDRLVKDGIDSYDLALSNILQDNIYTKEQLDEAIGKGLTLRQIEANVADTKLNTYKDSILKMISKDPLLKNPSMWEGILPPAPREYLATEKFDENDPQTVWRIFYQKYNIPVSVQGKILYDGVRIGVLASGDPNDLGVWLAEKRGDYYKNVYYPNDAEKSLANILLVPKLLHGGYAILAHETAHYWWDNLSSAQQNEVKGLIDNIYPNEKNDSANFYSEAFANIFFKGVDLADKPKEVTKYIEQLSKYYPTQIETYDTSKSTDLMVQEHKQIIDNLKLLGYTDADIDKYSKVHADYVPPEYLWTQMQEIAEIARDKGELNTLHKMGIEAYTEQLVKNINAERYITAEGAPIIMGKGEEKPFISQLTPEGKPLHPELGIENVRPSMPQTGKLISLIPSKDISFAPIIENTSKFMGELGKALQLVSGGPVEVLIPEPKIYRADEKIDESDPRNLLSVFYKKYDIPFTLQKQIKDSGINIIIRRTIPGEFGTTIMAPPDYKEGTYEYNVGKLLTQLIFGTSKGMIISSINTPEGISETLAHELGHVVMGSQFDEIRQQEWLDAFKSVIDTEEAKQKMVGYMSTATDVKIPLPFLISDRTLRDESYAEFFRYILTGKDGFYGFKFENLDRTALDKLSSFIPNIIEAKKGVSSVETARIAPEIEYKVFQSQLTPEGKPLHPELGVMSDEFRKSFEKPTGEYT